MPPHRQTDQQKNSSSQTRHAEPGLSPTNAQPVQEPLGPLVERVQRTPGTLTPHNVLQLQGLVGNHALNRSLSNPIQRQPSRVSLKTHATIIQREETDEDETEEDTVSEEDAPRPIEVSSEDQSESGSVGERRPIEVSSDESSERERDERRPIEVSSDEDDEGSETTVEEQRPVHTNALDDDQISYDAKSDQMRQGLRVLTKAKTLRAQPSIFSRKLAKLPARRAVNILAQPAKANKFSRSWMKVSVTLKGKATEGFVNTGGATENAALVHKNADKKMGAIMSDDGPTVDDIKQHGFGDCFLLASLLSLTRRRPDFVKNRLFVTNPTLPQATHTLQFFHETEYGNNTFRRETVTVKNTVLKLSKDVRSADGKLIKKGSNFGAEGPWNWPAIVEKAYTAWPGRSELDTMSGGQAFRASKNLTGEAYANIDPEASQYDKRTLSSGAVQRLEARRKDAIIAAAEEGDNIITASTKGAPSPEWSAMPGNKSEGQGGSGEMKVGGIAFNHVYEVVSADENEIRVRNPWGHYARVRGKIKKDEAESILTWDEFYMVFSGVNLAKSVADEAARNEPNGEEPDS